MLSNFNNSSESLNPALNISVERTVTEIEKKTYNEQIKIEKELNLENATGFQSFLLPLEKDLTKSSKGYESLHANVSCKKINPVNVKGKVEGSNISDILHCQSYLKRFNKFLDHNSPRSSNHCRINNIDNLCNDKCMQIIHDSTLNNTENDENVFSKTYSKKFHNSSSYNNENRHFNNNNVSEKNANIVYLAKCLETTSISSKSKDTSDDNDSSETDCSFNECNYSINYIDDSSSDDSIPFSEEVVNNKNWYSTNENKQTFVTDINSVKFGCSSADNVCLTGSEECTSNFFKKDFAFEFSSVNSSQSLMVSDTNSSSKSMIAINSEGYINACFEDDDFLFEKSNILKVVNESWNDSMRNVSEEPHESKKVSFVPLPYLVSIYSYEPEDDNYRYSLYVLDQIRFQNRVKDFESIIAPYLTPKYRQSIYRRNFCQDSELF